METFWIAVLAAFLIGYFALEGATIGTGMLLPATGRDERERATVVAGIGPFFLSNEVWLVAVVGILFGAFPLLEGTIMTGLYPVVVAFLLSWVVRSAGLWMRARVDARNWRALWDVAITLGSWGMAMLWGVALATTVVGLPTAPQGGTVDPLAPFTHPLAPVGAVTAAAVLALHGAAFTAARVDDVPGRRAARLQGRLLQVALAMLVLAGVAAALSRDGAWLPALVVVALVAVPVAAVGTAARRDGQVLGTGWTALVAAAPAAAVVVGSVGALQATVAPSETLQALTLVAGPVLPVLALAQIWLWASFRTAVTRATPSYI